MRILYVEDNATDADLFRRSLAHGWPEAAVSICASIAAARLQLEQAPVFDVVVTDLSLPDGCGLDLLEPARASRLPLAFVVLTGAGGHNAAIAALKSGVDDYLVKEGDYLGRLPATLGAAIAHARADRMRRNRAIRVLYAEPDRADAELAVRQLAQAAPQLRVDHVGHADEVVSRILDGDGACPHDLLLLDFQLSGASSLDVAKALRQDHGLDLPIVLVIAPGGEETAVQALRLGVSDYVVKHPGYLRELPLVLENAFRHAELVRERAALKATSERLAKVLSMSPSVNYALRFPGTGAELSWISDNVSRVLGYTPDEALQPGWLAGRVCGPDRQLFDAGLDELMRSDHRVQEYRLRHADGQTIWVRDEARLVRGERGEPVQAAGMLSDITEQRSATEMLRLNAAVIESTHDAIVITDLQGDIVSVNRAFTEVTGYSRDEVVGRNPRPDRVSTA
jgi:PAS domain S-box-containing protein